MSNSRSRKTRKSRREEEEEEEEEEDERVLFFIPSAAINIEVLVFYLKNFLGHDSDAEPGVHPRERDVDGYFIRSRLGLSTFMVADLKDDSQNWKDEKKKKKSQRSYADSDTAASRREAGASGSPMIPRKTQELAAARRAASAQPSSMPARYPIGYQAPGERNAQNQFRPDSISVPEPCKPPNHPQLSQASSFAPSSFGYIPSMDPGAAAQATSGYNINMNFASFSQTRPSPQRHESSVSRAQIQNVLPSIEGRHRTPAPPYEENEYKPSQPSTTGTQGFSNFYPTADSRHDRRR